MDSIEKGHDFGELPDREHDPEPPRNSADYGPWAGRETRRKLREANELNAQARQEGRAPTYSNDPTPEDRETDLAA